MQAFTCIQSSDLSSLCRAVLFIPRVRVSFPKNLFFCRANFAGSGNGGSVSLRVVPANLFAAEKEAARTVLTLFLKKHGLNTSLALRAVNKSEIFIDHLVSRLHSVYSARYLVGRELTTLEIEDALMPYLEALHEEYGDILVDVVESFPTPLVRENVLEKLPSPAVEERPIESVSAPDTTLNSKKVNALARVNNIGAAGNLHPHVIYLMELGVELELIEELIRKCPAFAFYSLERKVKPVVEFLLDLGVSKSDIPYILRKRHQLCGISLYENLIPTMTFLENLGVDKKKWAKVIYRFPGLLTYSRQKLKATVDFLYEMGVSSKGVGKILTHFPGISSYSVEDNLRPTAEYFQSMGVDVAFLLSTYPQTFGLSIEGNLKPVVEFFLEKGFCKGDVATMISRCGALCTLSLSKNLTPKWEFFLTMDYPKSELVKFPQYFSYSLEERIKPRHAMVRKSGVRVVLSTLLAVRNVEFEKVLKRKITKNGGRERLL